MRGREGGRADSGGCGGEYPSPVAVARRGNSSEGSLPNCNLLSFWTKGIFVMRARIEGPVEVEFIHTNATSTCFRKLHTGLGM